MDKKQLIDSLVSRITDYEEQDWGMNMRLFDWAPGVALYGICSAWKYTRNKRYFNYLENWAEQNLHMAYAAKAVNSAAPLLAILALYEETGNQDNLKVCNDIAGWLVKEAPRTREGGLEHTVIEKVPGFKEQLWADTLFMAVLFLAKIGRITGNMLYSEEASKQLRTHYKALKDTTTGLFFHGWNSGQGNWMSAVRWGRANAWITASTVEIISEVPRMFEGRAEVLESLIGQVKALGEVQKENGMFCTVVDDPGSYEETSATAGISYGIKKGVRLGYLPEEMLIIAEKAENAVINRVNERGEVEEVSYGTPIMPSAEDYKNIPRHLPTLYGQGLALLMLCQ